MDNPNLKSYNEGVALNTTMPNLIEINRDDTKLYIDTDSGASYVSISRCVRMTGMSVSGIWYRVNKVLSERHLDDDNLPQTYKGKVLIPESLIAEWIVKDNPELAGAMMNAGMRVYLHGLAGYRYQVKKVDAPKPEINPDNLDSLIDGLIQ